MFAWSSRYERLLQTMYFSGRLCRAADQSAWIVYIAPPSPETARTVLSRRAACTPMPLASPTPSEPPRVWKNAPIFVGGSQRVRSGEEVSPSSNTTTSSGSRGASSIISREK